MSNQVGRWQELASRLGVKVTSPASVSIGDSSVTFIALLPQFGGENGMIVDPDWEIIGPHADALLSLGYGFSTVEIGPDSDGRDVEEMLRDWGWATAEPRPSWW